MEVCNKALSEREKERKRKAEEVKREASRLAEVER
jgi:hypothetical protein